MTLSAMMKTTNPKSRVPALADVGGAIETVERAFPFPGYMTNAKYACGNVASTVLRYLPIGAHLLDFGAGPCDKTGVLAVLGYKCSAEDDLSDPWHAGNSEAILSFAKAMGIDYRLSNGAPAYDTNSFDLIMLTDVIEHIHDSPRLLLNSLITALKPEGLLLITVPNAVNIRKRIAVCFGKTNYQSFRTYFWSDRWRGHIREYTKDDLSVLIEDMGLIRCELRACDHMLQKVPVALRPLYKMLTSVMTGFKDSWTLVAKKPEHWSPSLSKPGKRERSTPANATLTVARVIRTADLES